MGEVLGISFFALITAMLLRRIIARAWQVKECFSGAVVHGFDATGRGIYGCLDVLRFGERRRVAAQNHMGRKPFAG